jgi:hypothetical protein
MLFSVGTHFHVCEFLFIYFCPDAVSIMNGTKDKNETAIERTQKNKNANKKAVRKHKLEVGEEYVSTSGKLVLPKVFVDTPCSCALKYNETVPKDKRERIFKNFYSLNWDLNSAFIITHVESVTKKRNFAKGPISGRSLQEFINCHHLIMLKSQ